MVEVMSNKYMYVYYNYCTSLNGTAGTTKSRRIKNDTIGGSEVQQKAALHTMVDQIMILLMHTLKVQDLPTQNQSKQKVFLPSFQNY